VLATILFTVFAFAFLMAIMAVGVVFQGKRLMGSCGGDPNSPACRCSPEKRARCRSHDADDADEVGVTAALLNGEALAPPGEQRLIQLRQHAER
jgi:hypothetical protein